MGDPLAPPAVGLLLIADAYVVWNALGHGPPVIRGAALVAAAALPLVLGAHQWGVRRLAVHLARVQHQRNPAGPSGLQYGAIARVTLPEGRMLLLAWLPPGTPEWLRPADRILVWARRVLGCLVLAAAAYYLVFNALYRGGTLVAIIVGALAGAALLGRLGYAGYHAVELRREARGRRSAGVSWRGLAAPAAWLVTCAGLFAAAWFPLRHAHLAGTDGLGVVELGFVVTGLSMASALGGALLLGVSRLLHGLGARAKGTGEGSKAHDEGRAALQLAAAEQRRAEADHERAVADRERARADRVIAEARLREADAEHLRAEADYRRAERGLPPLTSGGASGGASGGDPGGPRPDPGNGEAPPPVPPPTPPPVLPPAG